MKMMTTTLTPEMEALKAKLKATWTAGDFRADCQILYPRRGKVRKPAEPETG
jgi:hypothetical protein